MVIIITNFRSVSPTSGAYHQLSEHINNFRDTSPNFPIITPTRNITNAITNIDISLSLGSVAIPVIIAIFQIKVSKKCLQLKKGRLNQKEIAD